MCYRPPDGNVSLFLEFYDLFLTSVVQSHNEKTLIACGDFNIAMSIPSPSARDFNTTIMSNGFVNLINMPTRVTSESHSILDLVITNSMQFNVVSGVLSCSISDHLPVFVCIEKPGKIANKSTRITRQAITETSLTLFGNELMKINWGQIAELDDANLAYNMFIDTFKRIYHACFPLVTHTKSRRIRKPWITPELRGEIQVKQKLYRKFLGTRQAEDLVVFKKYRNKLTKKLRSARNLYHLRLLDVNIARPSVLWTRLNTLLQRNSGHTALTKLTIDGKEVSGAELANLFNTFLTNMTAKSAQSDACKYISGENSESIFLCPVTEGEVVTVIKNLNNSSSCDIDDIQIRPVKHVVEIIAPILAHIFNICLASAIFPQKMQLAKVVVLYKKGDRNVLGSYRLISILPVFSKVFEKMLHLRLSKFINKYNLLTPSQFGFCKNKSTEFALLEQKEYIITQLESKLIVVGLFVDFSKAFDLVDHNILLSKLQYYGFRGKALSLLNSYLSFRQQVVLINGIQSEAKRLLCGVPQGSILGSLLFNIYVNDIVNINSNAKFVIYADDTSLFFCRK